MKIHLASFASNPSTPTTLETDKPRGKGTRWFNSPDGAMHARSVKVITKTSGRGKDKKTVTIRRITYK
jgi:hypothetical protein